MKKKFKELLHQWRNSCTIYSVFFLVVFPASTGYQIKAYEFGSGGAKTSGGSYNIEGIAGGIAGRPTSANYQGNAGLMYAQQANVPTMTLQNTGSWYDKLNFIVGIQSNPTDATYAIAICSVSCSGNWTPTQWIQADDTIGASAVYQTYTNWGGASGENVIGLIPGTTYHVKSTSMQGMYTASPLGPETTAATVDPSISFKIDIGGTSDPGTTSPPYTVSFGDLAAGSVTTAANRVWISLATNANYGGYVYIRDQNAGLKSTALNYTISSATVNLAGANEGYGAQFAAVTPASGTILTPVNPYDSAVNIGNIQITYNNIFSTGGSAMTNGRAAFALKAKASATTPAAYDYGDTLTLVAASTF